MTKFCPKCLQDKPTSAFGKAKDRRDGLQPYCRDCRRSIDKAFYDKTPERRENIRGSRAAARSAAQAYVLAYLAEHPCSDCGEDDIVVLDFDHVRGTKRMAVAEMVRRGFAIATIQLEIDKCEVRCANCHRRVTAKRHGGWWKVAGDSEG